MAVKTYTTEEYFNKYNQMPPIRQDQSLMSEESQATRGFANSMQTASKPTPNWLQRQIKGIVTDMPDDFTQMGSNIRDRFSDRASKTGENIARRREDGTSLGDAFATGFDWATDTIRGAAIVVEEAGMFGLKQLTTQEQEEAIVESVGKAVQAGMEAYEGTKLQQDVNKIVATYNDIKEKHPELVGASENIAQILGTAAEVFGIGKGTTYGAKAIDTATDVIKQTAPKVQAGAETLARQTGEVVDATLQARRAGQLAAQEQKVQTAVGRILQAGDDPRAIEQATRALTDIDTAGIRTYDELNNRLSDRITALSKSVDERLAQDTNLYKPEQLAKTTKVGNEVITEDAVTNAIRGLENAYELSGEPVNAARVRQLATKYEQEGLFLVELNNLAREYGLEFKSRAFTRIGEPKQGYNADLYENTRKALKTTVRDQMPDDVAKQLDAKTSDIYSTLDLTKKIENTVAKLEQRITNRTLAQKVGGAIGSTADLLTGGILRGAINKLLPSNVGNKAMNSLEIQAELQKNLKELQRLSEIKDDTAFAFAFEQWAKNAQPGMSIRSTVTPASVGAKLTEKEFDVVVRHLDNVKDGKLDPEFNALLDKYGLNKAENAELEKFLKEATDQFERPEGTFTPDEISEKFIP
jgi:hypothetical protein